MLGAGGIEVDRGVIIETINRVADKVLRRVTGNIQEGLIDFRDDAIIIQQHKSFEPAGQGAMILFFRLDSPGDVGDKT